MDSDKVVNAIENLIVALIIVNQNSFGPGMHSRHKQVTTARKQLKEALEQNTTANVEHKYPNGQPMFAEDGTMLDENGNRSIFDDIDEGEDG